MMKKLYPLIFGFLLSVIPLVLAQRVDTVPEPKEVDFDASRQIPSDIQEQITWFVPGLGGGGDCHIGIDSPLWQWRNGISRATQRFDITSNSITWCIQDNNLNQSLLRSLSVELTKPDGLIEILPLSIDTYDNNTYISFTYTFGVGSQLGMYNVVLDSTNRQWEDNFMLQMPTEPVVDFNYNDFDLGNVWLVGFEPNQQIRAIVYNLDSVVVEWLGNTPDYPMVITFVGEQYYEVDSNGMLVINFGRLDEDYRIGLLILDPERNEVIGTNIPRLVVVNGYTLLDSIFSACTDVAIPRLSIGDTAQVTFFNNGLPLRIRDIPSISGEFLDSISHGTVVTVLAGPTCVDGYWWWAIETASGLQGWAAEGDDVDYFLEPES